MSVANSTTSSPPSSSASVASPVTTVFTPPSSCLQTIPIVTLIDSAQALFINSDQASSRVQTECFPSGYSPKSYLSPEPFCPVGYTAACASRSKSQTEAVCCPQGNWSCLNNVAVGVKTVIDIDRYPCYHLFTQNDAFTSAVFLLAGATFSGPVTLQPGASINGFANGVRIRWASTDVAAGITPAVTSAPLAGMTSPTATPAPVPSSTASKNDGKSLKLEVGLAVGIPVAFILLILAIATLWYRRRQQRDAVRDLVVDEDEKMFGTGEYGYRPGTKRRGSNHPDNFFDMGGRRPSQHQSRSRARSQTPSPPPCLQSKSPPPRFRPNSPPPRLRSNSPPRLRSRSPPRLGYMNNDMEDEPTKPSKQTRFNLPEMPNFSRPHSQHARSISSPARAYTPARPYTAVAPPQLSYNPLPYEPLLPLRPQSAHSSLQTTDLPPLAGPLHQHSDLPPRPQSPGLAVHTELWRQQQANWMRDERRRITDEYARIVREQQQVGAQVRDMVRREREVERARNTPSPTAANRTGSRGRNTPSPALMDRSGSRASQHNAGTLRIMRSQGALRRSESGRRSPAYEKMLEKKEDDYGI
ncbi:hypothetical protein BT63DRAFT_461232 [Microthyrium microscopicum]|uniref:Mid2 domain-containing protein n=1 Tax=Microthyrium microscopicum TaxID=703497 RepID=A0A6A6TTX0_9PEZI|nr:hypothetical protein BT63DRAFT_461232 [Microthyrium microscopicum]